MVSGWWLNGVNLALNRKIVGPPSRIAFANRIRSM